MEDLTQIARETAYHDTIRPIGLTWLAVSLVIPAILGFSPIGPRLVDRLRRRHWLLPTLAAVVGMTFVVTVVTLPFAAREHAIESRLITDEEITLRHHASRLHSYCGNLSARIIHAA